MAIVSGAKLEDVYTSEEIDHLQELMRQALLAEEVYGVDVLEEDDEAY